MANPPNLTDKDKYISLGTYKKNGDVRWTPIWFAHHEGKLFVYTGADSWKIKRINNNNKVEFAPCTGSGKIIGDAYSGTARIMSTDEQSLADVVLKRKYFLQRMFKFVNRIRRTPHVFVEISYE